MFASAFVLILHHHESPISRRCPTLHNWQQNHRPVVNLSGFVLQQSCECGHALLTALLLLSIYGSNYLQLSPLACHLVVPPFLPRKSLPFNRYHAPVQLYIPIVLTLQYLLLPYLTCFQPQRRSCQRVNLFKKVFGKQLAPL